MDLVHNHFPSVWKNYQNLRYELHWLLDCQEIVLDQNHYLYPHRWLIVHTPFLYIGLKKKVVYLSLDHNCITTAYVSRLQQQTMFAHSNSKFNIHIPTLHTWLEFWNTGLGQQSLHIWKIITVNLKKRSYIYILQSPATDCPILDSLCNFWSQASWFSFYFQC